MPNYRYSAKAGQEGGQGALEVKLYTNQSNTQPVIVVKAVVTQLGQKDISPILELKLAVFQSFKNGVLSDSDDHHYSVMYKEALTLTQAIEQKFNAGEPNPTSLIMLVHPSLVNGVAGVIA